MFHREIGKSFSKADKVEDQYGPQATIRRNFLGAKILLVDDNPDHCMLIQTVLQQCMPEVDLLIVATPEEALNQLSACSQTKGGVPRLILLDLYVPRREDGWQLIELLKESGSLYRTIPLTLISHSGAQEDIRASYDLGATSYIVKPTDYSQWLAYFQTLRQYWWHTVTLPSAN